MDFRKMRRFKQQIPIEECSEVLTAEKRGFLSVNGDNGFPYTVPIDFVYDCESGHIYFHSAKEGHKVLAMKADSRVCFTVCEQGVQKEDWSYHARSVVVFGHAAVIDDAQEAKRRVRQMAYKYYPEDTNDDIEIDIKKNIGRMYMFEITPEHITGKLVHEK